MVFGTVSLGFATLRRTYREAGLQTNAEDELHHQTDREVL